MYRVEVYLCCSIHHHLQSQPGEERTGSQREKKQKQKTLTKKASTDMKWSSTERGEGAHYGTIKKMDCIYNAFLSF